MSNLTLKEPLDEAGESDSSLDTTSTMDSAEKSDLYYWSAHEKKLYPLIGDKTYNLEWDAGSMGKLVTKIIAVWPPDSHIIPHIAETPPVTLDSSSIDVVTFKDIKYQENDSNLQYDSDGFQATTNGKSVLQFSRQYSLDIVPKDVALKFDGIDDYVDLGSHIDINQNNFTTEFWAQRSLTSTVQTILSQDPDPYRRGLSIGFNTNNTFTFGFYGDNLTTPASYTDTDWHHWACSYESVQPDSSTKYGPKVISLGFDGVDDFVSVTDDVPLSNKFTIEFWSKTNENAFQTVLGQGTRETNKGLHLGFLDDGRFTFGFYNNDLITDQAYPDVAWHHWAVSYEYLGPYGLKEIALNFDGGDDYIDVPDGIWFSGDFTVEGWVYLHNIQKQICLISFGNGPNNHNILVSLSAGTTSGQPYVLVRNSAGGDSIVSPYKIPLETWTHIAATLQGSTVKMYMNGIEVVSGETRYLPENVNRTKNYIGKTNWDGTEIPYGKMDEIRIWNRALTKQEINNQKDIPLTGTESGLIGYWPLNESKGRIAKDASGNGNDAKLMNMIENPWYFQDPEPVVASKPKDRYIEFDGVDDRIQVPDNTCFKGGDFTIEAWINIRSVTHGWTRIFQFGQELVNNVLLAASGDTADPKPGISYVSNGVYEHLSAPNAINLNEWAHVATTLEGSTLRLYINGVEVISKTVPQKPTSGKRIHCDIGMSRAWEGQSKFDGMLDDLRIWSVARSQEQIQNNKDVELTGDEANLEAYWKFNTANGIVALDSGPGKLHGNLCLFRKSPWLPPENDLANFPWKGKLIQSKPKERTLKFSGNNTENQNEHVLVWYQMSDYSYDKTIPNLNDQTIELWFKAERTTGENILYNKENYYEAAVIDGYFQYAWSPNWAWIKTFPVEPNTWYHVAVVYDHAKQKVYKNGELVKEANLTGHIHHATSTYGLMFGDRALANTTFKGEIDDIRIWQTARTQEEIFANKDHMLTGAEPGLVGYYPCDERDGNILYDHSPNRWWGWLFMDPLAGRKFNPPSINNPTQSWLAFDGVDDHVTIPASTWFNGGDFTIESWVKLNEYTNWAKIIDFGNGELDDNVILCASDQLSGKPSLQIYNKSGPSFTLTATDPIVINTWTHLAATLQGMTAKLYVNGVEVATNNLTQPPNNVTRSQNYIAKSNKASDDFLNGKIDELRIWNVAKTAEQIQQNLGVQLNGDESNLVAYWPFDERTGTVVADSTSGAKDGTLVTDGTAQAWEKLPARDKPTERAISFDRVDDYGSLPQGVWIDGDFTIESWVYLRSNDDYPALFCVGNKTGNGEDIVLVRLADIGLKRCPLIWLGTSGGTASAINPTRPLPLNVWTHFAVTLKGSTITIYYNGQEVKSGTTAYIPANVIRSKNYINGDSWGLEQIRKMDGMIDDLRLWSVAKTADEIRSNYTKTLSGDEPNLTGYWKFDEFVGNTAKDNSQGGNDITLVNMDSQKAWVSTTQQILANPKEQSIHMEGTNYVDVTDSTWFDGSNFTIEAWVHMLDYANWSRVLDFGNGPGKANVVLAATVGTSGQPALYFWDGADYNAITSPEKIPLKEWTHVAGVLDDTHLRIYINGVEVISQKATVRPENTHRTNCYIGKSNWNDKLFNGYMDEVRIWSVARTPDQIRIYKERPLKGNEFGLSGYWRFDDWSTLAKDSASGRHGTAVNRGYMCMKQTSFPEIKRVHMSAKNNTYIEVPHESALNTTTELTFETWVKPIQSGNNIILGKINSNIDTGYVLKMDNTNQLTADIWDQTGTKFSINLGTIVSSKWSHVAVTWLSNGKMTGYVNGSQVAQTNASTESIAMTADPFYISYSTNIAQVKIDDVRTWAVARSYSQIQQNMDTRLDGVEPGLIGYWRIDETQGYVVKDWTTNYGHGILHTADVNNAWALDTRGNRSIYRDGILIASDEPSQPYSGAGGMTFGATPWSTEYLNGQVDEIRVWDSLRTPDEIAAGMEQRLTPSEHVDLIRYWRIDEGSSDVLVDNTYCGLAACEPAPVTNQGQLVGSQAPDENWSNKVFDRKIFRDGEIVAEDQVVTSYAALGTMYLGKHSQDKNYFNGTIDELRFWNETKGGLALTSNNQKRLIGDEPNLSAYYRMDRQGMPYLEDSSGNAHYGLLMNKTPSRLTDNWLINPAIRFPASIGDLNKEIACIRVVNTFQWYDAYSTDTVFVADEITSAAHDPTCPHNGYIFRPLAFYNADVHTRDTMEGPIIPVNIEVSPGDRNDDLMVTWYQMHDGADFAYVSVEYKADWPTENRIVIASRCGSEGKNYSGVEQTFPDANGITRNYMHTGRYTKLKIYNQSDRTKAGFNPNEEHGVVTTSFKNMNATPVPQAAFALRNDLNITNRQPNVYTSDPYVLVEYLDDTLGKYQMAAFKVEVQDLTVGYSFNYTMNAGSPVVAPYPLNLVIAATPPEEIFGKPGDPTQRNYWEDHKGQPWALSGSSYLYSYFWYPLAPDFWYHETRYGNSSDLAVNTMGDGEGDVGAAVPWLPVADVGSGDGFPNQMVGRAKSMEVKYNTVWPAETPILKAGETITFSGGEYRADHTTSPGMPGVLAWSAGEVVFDSLNKSMDSTDVFYKYLVRLAPVLLERTVDLPRDKYPEALQPAGKLVDVVGTRYYFKELHAGIKSRIFYDSMKGQLGICGYVNDKTLGDKTLTASPPALYVLQPNIMTDRERDTIKNIQGADFNFKNAVDELYRLSRNPIGFDGKDYTVGLETYVDMHNISHSTLGMPEKSLGPGLALMPNAALLDPVNPIFSSFTDGYVVLAENNHADLGALPVSLHIIKVVKDKFRGAVKTIYSDNVFDEKITLRHTGDFGANPNELIFQWWYREDNGIVVDTPDVVISEWKPFPDPSGNNGLGQSEVSMQGAGAALLVDNLFYARYRHSLCEPQSISTCWSDWAGAANSRPGDYQAQLAEGWVKRVINAVNPYEARITSFNNIDSPASYVSMIQQAGQRFEGAVALNPDKDVIENVGLIELYQTVLNRAMDLSINLAQPVSTPGITAALLLASSRIADFYKLLGDDAYTDAIDPTIGYGSNSVEYGTLAPTIFTFMNQVPTLLDEELALLRGMDERGARPSYNRLMWNFTKSKGEVAYANAYGIWDINTDGFIDELDGQAIYPQAHGDAWGHYMSGLKGYYDILGHPYFSWETRSELFGMQGVVIDVDYLDEETFAALSSAKAKAGAEIVNLTYRSRYVDDPQGQWQGYKDTDPSRGWGVSNWGRRCFQGAYFDWVTSNTLLPSDAEALSKTGLNKIDRKTIPDLVEIAASAQFIQQEYDNANNGMNPLGLSPDSVPFDIDPNYVLPGSRNAATHFEQIYDRALKSMDNARAVFDHANDTKKSIRNLIISAEDFTRMVIEKDREFRNQLIEIFGSPYEGTIGPGKTYPAGYAGPDYYYYMYMDVAEYSTNTVPLPNTSMNAYFSPFGSYGVWDKTKAFKMYGLPGMYKHFFGTDFLQPNYTAIDYSDTLEITFPMSTEDYAFTAPSDWGMRDSPGSLQLALIELMKSQTELQLALESYDGLIDKINYTLEVMEARSDLHANELYFIDEAKTKIRNLNTQIGNLRQTAAWMNFGGEIAGDMGDALSEALPTAVGLAIDATSPIRSVIKVAGYIVKKVIAGVALKLDLDADSIERNKELVAFDQDLQIEKENYQYEIKEILKEVEQLIGDEATIRMQVFLQKEAMRKVSEQYKSQLGKGLRVLQEREAFNKKVASKAQSERYMDMALRLNLTDSLSKYRNVFDTAAKYVYLAAKAYDYETNLSPRDPASSRQLITEIIRNRTLGQYEDGEWVIGRGGLGEILACLRVNYDMLKGQMGFNNPQTETGRFSLRSELFRIKGSDGKTGQQNDQVWQQTLMNHQVADLWEVPEFTKFCRNFAPRSAGKQPGIVIPFGTEIMFGKNFFGWPLSGGDHAYDPSNFATKVRSVGMWFDGYNNGLMSETPRAYIVPTGIDVMLVPDSFELHSREWMVVDQKIPVPMPVRSSDMLNTEWIPSIDSLDGFLTQIRRYSSHRVYHDMGYFDQAQMTYDSRLVGRSVWNTNWVIIIPGGTLHYDPKYGLDMFVQTVNDIKLFFQTYAISGM
jgi:hypothetical protein